MTALLDYIARYRKGIVGAAIPAISSLAVATQRRTPGGVDITAHEWFLTALAALGVGAGVALTPNRPKRPKNPRPNQRGRNPREK